MTPTYDYEIYPSMSTSISSVHRGNPSSITPKMKGNSKEKQNIVLKHISAQINASIHGNSEYDQHPSAPHNSYNRSYSNDTKQHNDSIAGDKTSHIF
jgi:hypothetical protein